jgi:hypothetical protein
MPFTIFLLAIFCLASIGAYAQTVTSLPSASTPLDGTELLYIIQHGQSRKTTVDGLIGGQGGAGTIPFFAIGNGALAPASSAQRAGHTFNLVDDGGATCDWNGTTGTDDAAKIKSAIAIAGQLSVAIVVPRRCYSSQGLSFGTVPVFGQYPMTPTNPPQGPAIICAASIATACVTVGNSNGLGGSIRDLDVGYTGTPISGDSGIVIQGYNTDCWDVVAYNAYDGITFSNGIHVNCFALRTGTIVRDHVVVNGFPEVYLHGARLGMNGGTDLASNAFVGFTGYDPNTFECDGCQFNQGLPNGPSYLFDFFNLTNQTDGLYKIMGGHVEAVQTAVIHSDTTGTCFRCIFQGVSVNAPTVPMFALNASSPPMVQVDFSDDFFFLSSFTLPAQVYDAVTISNDYIYGTLTVNGSSGAIAKVADVEAASGATITGGPWANLGLSNLQTFGPYVDTATGNVYATNVPHIAWTPQLNFGGAHVGLTTNSVAGYAQRNPDGTISEQFGISVSAVGSSTGQATITGGVYTCVASGYGSQFSTLLGGGNLQSLTGTPVANLNQGTPTVYLAQSYATGYNAITQANFTGTSVISGEVRCTPQ